MTAVICVLLMTVTPVAAAPPKVTFAPDRKFVPVIVTDVPPVVLPFVGETDETAGGGVGAPAVVNDQTGPVAVMLAIVFPTMRQ